MTNPFHWQATPSDLPKDRKQAVKTTAEQILRAPHGGAYSKAAAAEVTPERIAAADSQWGCL
jgi:hypothetical protein